ncbi:hypothetical protein D7318_10885 [Streptomyces radicis]|uniref:Uncharacterized protein n=1 Tax=Streptomyces radicis TaxID=1750517 RepID=A0ABX9RKC7_9ACTN|nr:hypothetical protein D7318_10885 [Streptomyces radicis]
MLGRAVPQDYRPPCAALPPLLPPRAPPPSASPPPPPWPPCPPWPPRSSGPRGWPPDCDAGRLRRGGKTSAGVGTGRRAGRRGDCCCSPFSSPPPPGVPGPWEPLDVTINRH